MVFVAMPNRDILAFPTGPGRTVEGSVIPISAADPIAKGTKVVVMRDRRGHRAGRLGWLVDEPDDHNIVTVQFKGWCAHDRTINCSHPFFLIAPLPLEPVDLDN
jgi:hypothetical protein